MTTEDKSFGRAPWRVNKAAIAALGLLWISAWALVLVQAFAPIG